MRTKIFHARYLLLMIGLLACHLSIGQTFKAFPVESQNLAGLKSHRVFRINLAEIKNYISENPQNAPCKFIMDDQVFEWTLFENQMLKPDARGTTMRDGKYEELDFDRSCRTFIGYKPGSVEEARFTITKNNFIAMMPENGERVIIQSLHYFSENAGRELVVLYRESDVIRQEMGHCGVPSILTETKVAPSLEHAKKSPPSGGNRTYGCLELEVAFATDHRMFIDMGSAEDILDFNLTVLNFVEPFYDDFDLDFWVQDFFIVTSSNGDDTPWGLELDAGPLLDDFGDWADDYFGDQDIGLSKRLCTNGSG